jgi:hypothetical protein
MRDLGLDLSFRQISRKALGRLGIVEHGSLSKVRRVRSKTVCSNIVKFRNKIPKSMQFAEVGF